MKKLLCVLLCLMMILPSALAEDDDDDLLIEEIIESVEVDGKKQLLDNDGSPIITITCTGDFTIGKDTWNKKDIFTPELNSNGGDINFIFKNTRDIFLEDDLTLINFEGTLTTVTAVPRNKQGNSFLFSAPPEWVSVLTDNGVECVSLDNNHVRDHGDDGYQETKDTLDEAGIVWSGDGTMGIYEVCGIQVAMLSYLCIDRYEELWDKVPADIASAKAKYPLVIVSFHWGNELDYCPTANQKKMGHLAVDAGADLVIGHHSHRINPIEEYKGVYICYSLGNFCFAGNSKPSDMSSYIFQTRFKLKNDGTVENKGFRIIPIRISSNDKKNNFIPTPYPDGSKIDAVLSTLNDNGRKIDNPVASYPLEWK